MRAFTHLLGDALLGEGGEGVGDGAGGAVDRAADPGGGESFVGVGVEVVDDELAEASGGETLVSAGQGGDGGAVGRFCGFGSLGGQGCGWSGFYEYRHVAVLLGLVHGGIVRPRSRLGGVHGRSTAGCGCGCGLGRFLLGGGLVGPRGGLGVVSAPEVGAALRAVLVAAVAVGEVALGP